MANLTIKNRLIAAPMAGISDLPFRSLCYQFGAGLAFSEMFLANSQIWNTEQSLQKMASTEELGIKAVQIVGSDPDEMAKTAVLNVNQGAQLIDINMGCPAKKVNKKLAGSALLQYPELVEAILLKVVQSVNVPVTLKIRTGWDKAHKNCINIAQIAEKCGIKAITIHGRTRACLFKGSAEYDSIKAVKEHVTIPVIANGDITSPEKAEEVFQYTNADAIMLGRATQGRPWIFEDIAFYCKHGKLKPEKSIDEIKLITIQHIKYLHQFYGERKGLQIARKHVFWYTKNCENSDHFRRLFSAIDDAEQQIDALEAFFV
ncbi:tRNA dihydrouridine synthase DusB [Orbus hercynius]|uniref:tRNA dihydrouridine synthase DusB n=1 Tax=Orbus hercynius TaxID=593135 RepID=UPI002482D475|nr:tRNA dihydrouridine synthase DusB [Orbus hercynius]